MSERSLAELLKKGTPIPLKEAVRITVELLGLVAQEHAAGTLHRNIHPGCVFLNADGRVRLAGFELARSKDAGASPGPGEFSGLVAVMAPEQVLGAAIDERTDLYHCGLILYQLVTGRPAFEAPGAWERARKIASQDPLAPATIDPIVPWSLSDIVLQAVARAPADRFASAAEFADRLACARVEPWGPCRYLVIARLDMSANGPKEGPWGDDATAAVEPVMFGLRAAIGQHGGTVRQTIGEELSCSFEEGADVVGGMRASQAFIARSPAAARFSIGLKVAVHFGDSALQGEGLTGDKMSVAFRLFALCPPRGVFFSGAAALSLPDALRAALRPSTVRLEQPNGSAASARLIAGLAPLHEL